MSSSQSIDDLFQAAKRGDIDAVNRLISEGADVNAVGAHNNTPLHWATEEGHKGVVEVLLNNGANVNAQNDKEETPLDLATNEGIQTLLQNTTKLLEAAKNSDSDSDEVRRLISEGASVNATDEDRRTPLHWAAEKGYKQVVQALLDNGANVNAGAFGLNITPLHLAVASRHEKIVEILLNKGANVNLVESSRGMTSLWLAAEKGYGNVATVLLTAKVMLIHILEHYVLLLKRAMKM